MDNSKETQAKNQGAASSSVHVHYPDSPFSFNSVFKDTIRTSKDDIIRILACGSSITDPKGNEITLADCMNTGLEEKNGRIRVTNLAAAARYIQAEAARARFLPNTKRLSSDDQNNIDSLVQALHLKARICLIAVCCGEREDRDDERSNKELKYLYVKRSEGGCMVTYGLPEIAPANYEYFYGTKNPSIFAFKTINPELIDNELFQDNPLNRLRTFPLMGRLEDGCIYFPWCVLVSPAQARAIEACGNVQWCSIESEVFAHGPDGRTDESLIDTLDEIKRGFMTRPTAFMLSDETFTVSELREIYEEILSCRFDQRNFLAKLRDSLHIIKPVDKDGRSERQRYRFDLEEYQRRCEEMRTPEKATFFLNVY